jgi:hypothetical protein
MSRAKYQEPIRRSTALPVFTQDVASVPFHQHPDFASLQVFTCDRLKSVLTKEACAANYTRSNAPLSCKGCPIGSAHAYGLNYRDKSDRHATAEAAHGLSCIRCERNVHTATKYIARFRLTRKHTLCLNCFNREREVVRGYNAKGAKPVKHSGLKTAAITVETAEGKHKVEDIGLRSGYLECARYVERVMPGATLLKTEFDGETIGQFSLWTPPPFSPREPGMISCEKPKKPTRMYIRRVSGRSSKPSSAIASPVDWDDWDTPLYKFGKPVESDESDSDSSRQARRCGWLPPMSAEDDEAYRQSFEEPALDPESIAAYWDLTADGLPDFIEWLTDGWPTFKRAPEWEPSAADKAILNRGLSDHLVDCAVYGHPKRQAGAAVPSAPVADAVAFPEVSDAVVSDSDKPEHESEWAGCYIVRDGVTTYVCDYTKERGISDEEAAIELGLCDPDYADEPAPEPEPVAQPAFEHTKKLTKAEKKTLKKSERAARQQAHRKSTAFRPSLIAITARAYMTVLFETGVRK